VRSSSSASKAAVIVGVDDIVGDSAKNRSPDDLTIATSYAALADAGIDPSEVDAVFCASPHDNMPSLRLAEILQVNPRYFDGTSIGGGSYESFVGHAALALESGSCDVALLAYGSAQRSARGSFTTRSAPPPAEVASGMIYPASSFALMATRYLEVYGGGPEQLAEVAVSAREWARHNPRAARRELLTVEDVIASPVVSSPLRKLDCCLVTDGAGAVVMTRADRAAHLPKRPVHVRGFADASTHRFVSAMPDLLTTAAAKSGPNALRMAGMEISDIDLFEIYDAFTIDVLLILEDLGVCGRGEAGKLFLAGDTRPGGRLPINTNGGGLSYAHPGMYGIFLLVEAVRQLRGESQGYQVSDPNTALVHGLGGPLSSGSTVVLANEGQLA